MPKPASTGLIRIRFELYKCSANWQLLREVCLPFLLPYPILAAVMDGDILSRPSSL